MNIKTLEKELLELGIRQNKLDSLKNSFKEEYNNWQNEYITYCNTIKKKYQNKISVEN